MKLNTKTFVGTIVLTMLISACSNEKPRAPSLSLDIHEVDISSQEDVIDDVDASNTLTCDKIEKTNLAWCTCNPQCCQSQQWFCHPVFGDPSYYKKEVVVNTCDENLVPCQYGSDFDCPPPEILYTGECTEAYECPPGAQSMDYGWQWCVMPDGTAGKQNVKCDKGQLFTTDCQPCLDEICNGIDDDCDGIVDENLLPTICENECGQGNAVCVDGVEICFGPQPQEEICDYLDNDCDGEVDEFQLNACNQCGPVPSESCNNIDDDCDGETDEELMKPCETDCGVGVEICAAGKWSGCTAQQPQPEVCDGLDNNCNGSIDEEIECLCSIQDVGKLMPCSELPLLCGQGFKTCVCVDDLCQDLIMTECMAMCYWSTDPPGNDPLCDPLVGMPLEKEDCNNFDDNCNQLVDEDLAVACYTGPEGTLNIGICSPGIMTCEAGVWGNYNNQQSFIPSLCGDEVLPQEEICDGLDNDCDGEVDWGEEIPDTDILFIVDWSGSMSDEIDAVLIALNQFAANYADQDALRWGLIVGPRQMGGWQSNEELN